MTGQTMNADEIVKGLNRRVYCSPGESALDKQAVTLIESQQAKLKLSRNGNWTDKFGACVCCDGEIPHGHSENCDIHKLQKQVESQQEQIASLSKGTIIVENYRLKKSVESQQKRIEQQQEDVVQLASKVESQQKEIEELKRTILLMKPYVKRQHSWSCRNSTREQCTCGWEGLNQAIDAAMQETKP